MSENYSRLVSVDELSDEQVKYWADLADESVETYREIFAEMDVIEIGRVDYDYEIGGFRTGGEAIIDPCPFCDGEHTHGFRESDEAQGKVTPRSPHCDVYSNMDHEIMGDYWIVWFGKGEGEWVGDADYTQQPVMGR